MQMRPAWPGEAKLTEVEFCRACWNNRHSFLGNAAGADAGHPGEEFHRKPEIKHGKDQCLRLRAEINLVLFSLALGTPELLVLAGAEQEITESGVVWAARTSKLILFPWDTSHHARLPQSHPGWPWTLAGITESLDHRLEKISSITESNPWPLSTQTTPLSATSWHPLDTSKDRNSKTVSAKWLKPHYFPQITHWSHPAPRWGCGCCSPHCAPLQREMWNPKTVSDRTSPGSWEFTSALVKGALSSLLLFNPLWPNREIAPENPGAEELLPFHLRGRKTSSISNSHTGRDVPLKILPCQPLDCCFSRGRCIFH